MSLENHPNFHAVGFAVDVVESFYKRLRIDTKDIDFATEASVQFETLGYIERIELLVDKCTENRKELKKRV